MSNNGRWSKEKAWAWYNSHPWIRGCNFMSSDCCNRIDQWQELGFEKRFETANTEMGIARDIGYNSLRIIVEFDVWYQQHDGFMKRFDKYLEAAHKNGLSCTVVLGNDCCVPKSLYKPKKMGQQTVDRGYHGGVKISPHAVYEAENDDRYSPILDEPENCKRFQEMVAELISEYAHDERVILWNMFNEPGNGRGNKSMDILKRVFEIGREINPDQPLCADVWRGVTEDGPTTEIEKMALDLSDVISYHNYSDYNNNIETIDNLKKYDRPIFNTEWLHRIAHNNVAELFPLFYLENIACYNWGLVAGLYQTYEPWEMTWQALNEHPELDVTKWQHDLIRPSGRPYDPKEIEIIKHYCKRADESFARKNK